MNKKETDFVKTQDEKKIFYDHLENGFKSVIIIAHGFFNSKEAVLIKGLAEELSTQFDVIIMDFRGHGASEDLFHWTTKEYMDLYAVVQFAREKYQRVGVIGFSLGAATTLICASKSSDLIDSIVSVSAPTDFDKIEYHFWEMNLERDVLYNVVGEGKKGKGVRPGPFWQKKDKPIDIVEQITCPVFYIHGAEDWLIKSWHSQALYDKTNARKKIALIEEGPHAEYLILNNKEETVSLILEWFEETLNH